VRFTGAVHCNVAVLYAGPYESVRGDMKIGFEMQDNVDCRSFIIFCAIKLRERRLEEN
jgi:hypothetical protein